MKQKQFVMLSGLPRTGSTLLSSILNQNPKIHAEGNSGLCQLMWDLEQSCKNNCGQQLTASGRMPNTMYDVVSALPNLYYKNVKKPIIFDKCRSWTLYENVRILREYFPHKPKIVVMIRKMEDIIKSFAKLELENGFPLEKINQLCANYFIPMSEPIMRSLNGIVYALECNSDEFLFVNYDDLIDNPNETLNKIYNFCEWDYYNHDLKNIINKFPEDDEFYGLKGFHQIRPTINKINNNIVLPNEILNFCKELDSHIRIT